MENYSISDDYVHPKQHKLTILSITEQFLLVSSSTFGLDSLMPVMFSLIHHCFRHLTVPHYELKSKCGFKVSKITNSVSLIMQTVCCTGLHTQKGVHNNHNPKNSKNLHLHLTQWSDRYIKSTSVNEKDFQISRNSTVVYNTLSLRTMDGIIHLHLIHSTRNVTLHVSDWQMHQFNTVLLESLMGTHASSIDWPHLSECESCMVWHKLNLFWVQP